MPVMEILNNITCSKLAYPWGKTAKVRLREVRGMGSGCKGSTFSIPMLPYHQFSILPSRTYLYIVLWCLKWLPRI